MAETWQDRALRQVTKDGYADPEKMVAQSEARAAKADWHPYPWKDGAWVNAKGTVLYEGNGGNQREEHYWFTEGPWLLLGDDELDDIRDPLNEQIASLTAELERVRYEVNRAPGASDD